MRGVTHRSEPVRSARSSRTAGPPYAGVLWLLSLSLACAGTIAPRETGSATAIGLQRGSGNSSLMLRLPHMYGPSFMLHLSARQLTGWASGELGPAGAFRVTIEQDGARGKGPHGTISVDYLDRDDHVLAEGQWNGERMHLEFSQKAIRGTVADNSARVGSQPGWKDLDPEAAESSCLYSLEMVDRPGSFSGTSTCNGMPEETRFEIPAAVEALFTRAELLTVLISVLSTPPAARGERRAPFGPAPDEMGFRDGFGRSLE
jgi:hypothetical protein